MQIAIPEKFAKTVAVERGEAGAAWLRRVPSIVEAQCRKWKLQLTDQPKHGHLSLVFPVRGDRHDAILKLAWNDEQLHDEATALSAWNGNGAVKLLDLDLEDGVLLVEALDADSTLEDVPIDDALAISAKLLRRLAIEGSVIADRTMRSQSALYGARVDQRWTELNRPLPHEYVSAALFALAELAPSIRKELVNYDLHFGNVLEGTREPWLAIDPKVLVGDVEFGIIPMLWRRFDEVGGSDELERRFNLIVEAGNFHADRARKWIFVRCLDYWLWALSFGLTEDPKTCAAIAKWLLPHVS